MQVAGALADSSYADAKDCYDLSLYSNRGNFSDLLLCAVLQINITACMHASNSHRIGLGVEGD